MKLPEARIEMVASDEESRFALNGVFYDVSKNVLVATDGRMLAVLPHDHEDGDAGGIIPAEAFKDARKLAKKAKKRKTELAILQDDQSVTFSVEGLQSASFDLVKGEFPKYEALLPKNGDMPPFTVALNAELLYRLALALQEESTIVHLHISGPDAAIVVKPSAAKNSIGLLMPTKAFKEQ